MWRIRNQEKEWFMPATFISHGMYPAAGERQLPRALYKDCPHKRGTSQLPWTGSSINTRLISRNSQDLRVSARGLPVHMERSPLGTERFWGLALQLAGSAMVVRGLEWLSCGEQQAVISLWLVICPSLHWMLLAGSKGLKGTAGREQ